MRPPDADRTLQALDDAGFDTEASDPAWIYKAVRDGVLVDVIFRVRGDIHLDDDMLAHARTVSCQGQPIQLMSPEDAVVIEAVSHDVQAPEHWHNALGILAASDLDWAYLERRARFGVRRMISLLTYAHSNDLIVPEWVVRSLFEHAYGPEGTPVTSSPGS